MPPIDEPVSKRVVWVCAGLACAYALIHLGMLGRSLLLWRDLLSALILGR